MKSKRIDSGEARTWVLAFAEGDEVIATLSDLARREQLAGSHFTAIGAFSAATLGFFDLEKRDYERIPVREQVEVLALTGNVALADGEPKIHAHVVLGRRDGSALGGHLLEAQVRPTLEVVLREEPVAWQRRHDEATGLPLLAP
jgi:predicted DNA-binding protein with PD1-like motif